MWVPPDAAGVAPGYQEAEVDDALASGGLVLIAGGNSDAALGLHQTGAQLWIARAPAGAALTVPAGAHVHVFVARGAATLDGVPLATGDAVRLTGTGPTPLAAGDDGAEVVVWATS
jgi:redox-sensitive bicupin YhaK (pirin superfamily)